MNEATPSSLNPWISKDTILFGKAKNHLADCKWLKVCGLDVTITWQPCNKEPVSKHWANSKGFKTVVAAFFPWTFGLSGCPINAKKKKFYN